MKKGNILVEQVTKEGYLIDNYDESLSPSEIYDRIAKYFPKIHKLSVDQRILIGEHKGHKFAIRCKNVTYLGNPHPHYKKRIQIAEDLYDFYKVAQSIDAEPILLGIYSCGENTIFVNFKIDTYIDKKANNSSAHVYVSDLMAATEDGYFQKIDYFGNTITAIRPDVIDVYLDEFFGIDDSDIREPEFIEEYIEAVKPEEPVADHSHIEPETEKAERTHAIQEDTNKLKQQVKTYAEVFQSSIVPKIKDFFRGEKKEWHGIECYKTMIAANYKNKYQPEWVGFFLEYEFEKFLIDNKLYYLITYAQDKKDGGIDLDLFFPTIESYGDLKAHSEESRGIQGNDWDTIFRIINGQDEKSHVYYIVCEHSTEKDCLHDYEVTKFWNTVQNKTNLMSYSTRMKNKVTLKRIYILDINYSNREYLTKFKQGINSNGKPRSPKIMIEQDNLQKFVIAQMTLNPTRSQMENFKFIDLFSGIGGFHQAMEQLGGECVFASEIDKFCNAQYERNYGMRSDINIRDVKEEELPKFDVLCAGFPCQSFSKAGKQLGLEDKTRGTLFFEIVRILKHHHTPYIVLENVRNLVSHDNGNTWRIIQESLRELGYRTTKEPLILSPHFFGIPQIRERVIILGKYDPENIDEPLAIDFGKFNSKEDNTIYSVLNESEVDKSYYISKYEEMVLQAWDEFYQGINLKVIGFPVWAEYFKHNGKYDGLPQWKAGFIKKNVKLYEDNKEFIDNWLKKYNYLKEFTKTHRKMEWQCGTDISSVWEGVIQFRPSGIRIKKPNNFQALVAMVQIPVIGKFRRRLTVEEAARLQSFPVDDEKKTFFPDDNRQQAYKQFGNSVNVEVIRRAAKELFKM